MKLHHFVTQPASEEGAKARNAGRALAQVVPAPSSGVELLGASVTEAAKKVVAVAAPESADKEQAHRDFAEDQLARTNPRLHRHMRHYG